MEPLTLIGVGAVAATAFVLYTWVDKHYQNSNDAVDALTEQLDIKTQASIKLCSSGDQAACDASRKDLQKLQVELGDLAKTTEGTKTALDKSSAGATIQTAVKVALLGGALFVGYKVLKARGKA